MNKPDDIAIDSSKTLDVNGLNRNNEDQKSTWKGRVWRFIKYYTPFAVITLIVWIAKKAWSLLRGTTQNSNTAVNTDSNHSGEPSEKANTKDKQKPVGRIETTESEEDSAGEKSVEGAKVNRVRSKVLVGNSEEELLSNDVSEKASKKSGEDSSGKELGDGSGASNDERISLHSDSGDDDVESVGGIGIGVGSEVSVHDRSDVESSSGEIDDGASSFEESVDLSESGGEFDTYKGARNKAGQYHGQGTLIRGESKYVGSFVNGKKHGKGTEYVLYSEEKLYEGDFKDGKRHGQGKEFRLDDFGEDYNGAWEKGLRHGKGEITTEYDRVVGSFENGKKHGHFKEYDDKGNEVGGGEYKDDLKSGKWTCSGHGRHHLFYKGDYSKYKYDGFYKEGKFHGQGTLENDRYKYEGSFVNGEKSEGKLFCKDSEGSLLLIFEGTWKDYQYLKGALYDENGEKVYDGEFKDHKKHGSGTSWERSQTTFKPIIYVGQFQKDKKHGQGIIYNDKQEKMYEGGFKDDKKHGQGKLYNTLDGKLLYDGVWEYGLKHGQGKEYAWGKKYEGLFENGKRHGQGKLYKYSLYNELTLEKEGTWKEGVFQEK